MLSQLSEAGASAYIIVNLLSLFQQQRERDDDLPVSWSYSLQSHGAKLGLGSLSFYGLFFIRL